MEDQSDSAAQFSLSSSQPGTLSISIVQQAGAAGGAWYISLMFTPAASGTAKAVAIGKGQTLLAALKAASRGAGEYITEVVESLVAGAAGVRAELGKRQGGIEALPPKVSPGEQTE